MEDEHEDYNDYALIRPPAHLHLLALVALLALAWAALLPTPAAHAAGPVCYVNASASAGGANDASSWSDAYTDLQAALGNVGCTEIWVAAGTYYPTSGTDRTVTFQIKNNVAIYGGFSGTETARDQRHLHLRLEDRRVAREERQVLLRDGVDQRCFP